MGENMYSLDEITAMVLEGLKFTMPDKIAQIRFEDFHNAKGIYQAYTDQGQLVYRTKYNLEKQILYIDDLTINDSFKVKNPPEVMKYIREQQIKI
jgi:hypothetical protein